MGKRQKRAGTGARGSLKRPINPSVWGTAEQADRMEKGGRTGSGKRSEGSGHPPGSGRAGKTA